MTNPISMSPEERWHQYKLCGERGHDGAAVMRTELLFPTGKTWLYCRHCGTEYSTETQTVLYERNAPEPPPNEVGKVACPSCSSTGVGIMDPASGTFWCFGCDTAFEA